LSRPRSQQKRRQRSNRPTTAPPPPPTPQELARKELAQYKSLGLLKKQGKQVAFLTKGGQIKLIRVGDSLINGYKVTAITDDRLVLRAMMGMRWRWECGKGNFEW